MRCLIGACIALCALLAAAGSPAASEPPLKDRIDRAHEAAATFLLETQQDDGAWRSQTYGAYRDGPSLTAHVLTALVRIAPDDDRTKRGLAYLAGLVNVEGDIESPLIMTVYTASQTAQAFMDAGRHDDARPWLKLLLAHQLTEECGWSPVDVQYGGWGYSTTVPKRPELGEHAARIDANISATVFALAALHQAKKAGVMDVDQRVFTNALGFVHRCQNVTALGPPDDAFDDGGFFFTPIDAVRNKAGAAGMNAAGRERFHSYGSATADGHRALALAGEMSFRRRAVRTQRSSRWIDQHFDAVNLPGSFNPDREVLRDAYYFYYAWSLAHALRMVPFEQAANENQNDRRDALARELLRRQNEDGSWTNRFTDGKENDPLIATAFAALALIACR